MPAQNKTVFTITLFTAIALMALFITAVLNGWFGPSTGVGAEFCEADRPGLIKQPANTWSNFGFIAAGLVMAWQLSAGVFKNNNSITRSVFYGTFFSCLAVFLGPGSMAMHATTTQVGGFLDMLSMYLVASFVVAYAMQRFFRWQPMHFTLVFVLVLAACLWANFQTYRAPLVGFFGNAAFAVFISLGIFFEILNTFIRKTGHSKTWGWVALASLLLAFFIWNFSQNGSKYCDPSSLVQGHAIWHLLDAFAVYGLFRFYASEHREAPGS